MHRNRCKQPVLMIPAKVYPSHNHGKPLVLMIWLKAFYICSPCMVILALLDFMTSYLTTKIVDDFAKGFPIQ